MKARHRQVAFALVLVLGLTLTACAPAAPPAPAQPAATAAPATAAPAPEPTAVPATKIPDTPVPEPTAVPAKPEIKLTFWWWGEEGMGQEEWVRDTIEKYKTLHPEITVEPVFLGLDEVLTNFAAAAQAGQGPDIATLWYGMYMYDAIWAGQIEPLDQYVSTEEMAHWSGMELNKYDGKTWAGNIYNQSNSVSYNKKLFTQVGLDAEKPPETWADLMAACEKFKAAGIACIGMGSKDGWVQGPFTNLFLSQTTEPKEVAAAVIGERNWTEKPFADFWYRLAELRDKGYINADVTSLDYYQGQTLVETGKAAIIWHASDASAAMIQRNGDDTIGPMAAPSVIDAPLGWLVGISYAFFVTEWSPHKAEAADFLSFFHNEEVLKTAYTAMKGVVLPADDRFDASAIESPGIKKIFELQLAGFKKNKPHLDAILPWAIIGDGMMPAFQKMLSDNLSPEDAAKMTEDAAKTWRELNPELLENYTKWAAGL